MSKFTEEKLEKAFTDLFAHEGYPHHSGISINPAFNLEVQQLLANVIKEISTVNKTNGINFSKKMGKRRGLCRNFRAG